MIRIVLSILGIVACVVLITASAQFGFARLLARYGFVTKSIPAAAQAVRLTPKDAEAHRALAVAFRNVQMYREAAKEFEIAASLRPADDYLWLELGTLRDELDDQAGALSAFDQSVANAPYYAHTRWQRANLRLRMGRYDEAFAELREATKSNKVFLPSLIDLAWGVSRGDIKTTEQLVGIESTDSRIAFARFLAGKGKGRETREQFVLVAASVSEAQKRELIAKLSDTRQYGEAFNIWKGTDAVVSEIYDGGFEGPISFGGSGFGWNIPRELPKISISIDTSEKDTGAKSIRIAFDGPSPAATAIISQPIIIKAGQKYRINFAVKAKGIITGGVPLLRIADVVTNAELAHSANLPQNSANWEKSSFEFTAPATNEAVVLQLARNECQSQPCPIFGVLWLDSLSIEEIK
ncbi:MAG TPA: hypothetical protein VI306_11005 [Pyrinomonadaceae bacterium]